jgi:type I restriction enzyme M protein
MRGIKPDNIVTRNGDTLEDDWPFFDDSDPIGTIRSAFMWSRGVKPADIRRT